MNAGSTLCSEEEISYAEGHRKAGRIERSTTAAPCCDGGIRSENPFQFGGRRKIGHEEIISADRQVCADHIVDTSILGAIEQHVKTSTGIGWLDSVGAGGIAWFSLKEGREAFRKAKGLECYCAGKCGG